MGQTAEARFEIIYLDTYFRLAHFVRNFIKQEGPVQDVLQETYIKLWENLDHVKDDEKLLPLLRTYATHIMINALRKAAREQVRAQVFYSRQELTQSSELELDQKETQQAYHQALESMPPTRRLIYRLTQDEGLTYQEIAEKLHVSASTIKYHLGEARKTLRGKLSADHLAMAIFLAELYRLS